MRLAGKTAIVTGAGRGIGRGEAKLLAAEGASVVVNDLGGEWDGIGRDTRAAQQVVDEIASSGGTAIADYEDVADWDGGRRLVERAIVTYGRVDILVCNAGILRDRMVFNMEENDWDAVIRVHLKGHFVPVHVAARHWRERAKATGQPVDASVVLTSSGSGLYGNAGQSNYVAAKAGIAGFGIAVARELAQYGVRVNTVSPSARTRLTEQTFGEARAKRVSPEAFDADDPDNIAPWVVFLCTEAARDISGRTFGVRAGRVELLEGWHTVAAEDKHSRWDIAELPTVAARLFANRPLGPPPLPF